MRVLTPKEYEYLGYTLEKIETEFNPIYRVTDPEGKDEGIFNIERAKQYINDQIAFKSTEKLTGAFYTPEATCIPKTNLNSPTGF